MGSKDTDKRAIAETRGGGVAERSSDIGGFLEALKKVPAPKHRRGERAGRIVFALDATMSRQPTWDLATDLQASMFLEATHVGRLEVQLVYFRGFRECRSTRWLQNADALAALMTRIDCRAGRTQIGRVLAHAVKAAGQGPVDAVIYVGDSFEEDIDEVGHQAGALGVLGVPVFTFHEGKDAVAAAAFQEIARASGGVYCPFDLSAPGRLAALLGAIAIFAAGGREALAAHALKGPPDARRLLERLPPPRGR